MFGEILKMTQFAYFGSNKLSEPYVPDLLLDYSIKQDEQKSDKSEEGNDDVEDVRFINDLIKLSKAYVEFKKYYSEQNGIIVSSIVFQEFESRIHELNTDDNIEKFHTKYILKN